MSVENEAMQDASSEFSDFIVYADESGNQDMANINPKYPVFALTFCVMRKEHDIACVDPAIRKLKFKFWGHDAVVLHGNPIRRKTESFEFLQSDPARGERFFRCLNDLIKAAPITFYTSVIHKERLQSRYITSWDPYHVALHFCMEQLWSKLHAEKQQGKRVHVVFEGRNDSENKSLELEFLRIAEDRGQWGLRRLNFRLFDFEPVFLPKNANSSGLQLADLAAQPIALSRLHPEKENRAFKAIEPKLGEVKYFP